MSLLALIKGRRGESGFGFASTAEEVTEGLDLSGKRVLITGINSGLLSMATTSSGFLLRLWQITRPIRP